MLHILLCHKEPSWLCWPLLPLPFSLPHAGSTGLQRETIFTWQQLKSQLCSVAHSRTLLRTLPQVRPALKDQFCSSLSLARRPNTMPILPYCFKFLCLLMLLVLCTVTQLCGHLTIGVYQTNWMHYIRIGILMEEGQTASSAFTVTTLDHATTGEILVVCGLALLTLVLLAMHTTIQLY